MRNSPVPVSPAGCEAGLPSGWPAVRLACCFACCGLPTVLAVATAVSWRRPDTLFTAAQVAIPTRRTSEVQCVEECRSLGLGTGTGTRALDPTLQSLHLRFAGGDGAHLPVPGEGGGQGGEHYLGAVQVGKQAATPGGAIDSPGAAAAFCRLQQAQRTRVAETNVNQTASCTLKGAYGASMCRCSCPAKVPAVRRSRLKRGTNPKCPVSTYPHPTCSNAGRPSWSRQSRAWTTGPSMLASNPRAVLPLYKEAASSTGNLA
jgi:hypothetical protein